MRWYYDNRGRSTGFRTGTLGKLFLMSPYIIGAMLLVLAFVWPLVLAMHTSYVPVSCASYTGGPVIGLPHRSGCFVRHTSFGALGIFGELVWLAALCYAIHRVIRHRKARKTAAAQPRAPKAQPGPRDWTSAH